MSHFHSELTNCPKCNASWKRIDIYEAMLSQCGNEEQAKRQAAAYGWTETNRKFFQDSCVFTTRKPTKLVRGSARIVKHNGIDIQTCKLKTIKINEKLCLFSTLVFSIY